MLKKWRRDKGYTQAELARLLGVSQNTVSYWESGAVKPDILMAEKLANILGVSVGNVIEHFKTESEQGA